VTGNPVAKVIWNLGREDSVDKDALRRLMQSIALDQLWTKLGIRSALEELLRERQSEAPVERAIFAMTANRAMDFVIDSNEHIQEKAFFCTANRTCCRS